MEHWRQHSALGEQMEQTHLKDGGRPAGYRKDMGVPGGIRWLKL